MFENRVIRKIFRPKREEVAGGWRRLHNEELHYASPNIIRVIKSGSRRWAVRVVRMVKNISTQKMLVGKYKGEGPLRRRRGRYEDNIRMDLREISWGSLDWMHLAEVRTRDGVL
jgi:hypothetical protein